MERLMSLVGLFAMVGIAYALSSSRKDIKWKTVGLGLALQLTFALIILKTPFGMATFDFIKEAFNGILNYTLEGSKFLFGPLTDASKGWIFATMVLPTIIFMSSLMSVLYHVGIMQKLVEVTAKGDI